MLLLTACASDPQLQDQNAVLNKELKHARVELYEAQEKIKTSNGSTTILKKRNP
jgi:hypothetical protein